MNVKKLKALKKLSFNDKELLNALLSEIIEKATGESSIDRREKAHIRLLVKTWNDIATKANKKAVAAFPKNTTNFTTVDANKVLNAMTSVFKGIEQPLEEKVLTFTEDVYKEEKKNFATRFKLKPPKKSEKSIIKEEIPEIGTAFDLTDEALVAEIARLETISIGNHFPSNIKPAVGKTLEKGIEQGLNKKQMGELLKKELTAKVGGDAFKAVPKSIAAQGQKSVNAYFDGLASTNTTLARNASHINAMQQAEITRLMFSAVMDNRTSQICSQLNGRIFTIEQASNHLNTILESEDVEDLKTNSKWYKSVDEIPGNTRGTGVSSDALAKAGVLVPPLHFRCRSELIPA